MKEFFQDVGQTIMTPLNAFVGWFWAIPILVLIGGGGIWVFLRLGGLQIRRFPYICSQTFGKMFKKAEKEGDISPFSAATAALASSIGASNIVGVPSAIGLGGPGAIFWMWILAILGCGTKFVEIVLGVHYREKLPNGEYSGGPFYYCSKGLKEMGLGPIGKFVGIWFAFLLMIEIIPSVATQSASAVQNMETIKVAGHSIGATGATLAITLFVFIVVAGGLKRLVQFTDKMVPIMAVLYIIGALIIIIINFKNVPGAFASIFEHAFSPMAPVGGFAGATIAATIRWGAARGVYSNEAGMGTAPIAHSTATVDHPVRQGMWGVFEVVVDTLIICTITALCVLSTGMWKEVKADKVGSIPSLAFRHTFGYFGDVFLTLCVLMFVLSTIIVIVFYGARQAEFLFGAKFARGWKYVYVIACIGGQGFLGDLNALYNMTDAFLGLIIIPNMICVILLTGKVAKLTKEYFNTPDRYYLADMAEKELKKAKKAGK